MLTVKMQVSLGNVVRIGHIIFLGWATEPVGAAAILLGVADRCVNGNLGDVTTLGAQLSRHTLGQAFLRVTCHGKCLSLIHI